MAIGNEHLAGDAKKEQGSRLWYAFGSIPVVLAGLISVPLLMYLWPPQLGIELAGGVRVVYEIEDEYPEWASIRQEASPAEVTPKLLRALHQRLDPSNTKELVVQRQASNQVEILLPALDLPDYELVKKTISTDGFLQFLIVANSRDHGYLISRAREQAEDPGSKQSAFVYDEDEYLIGVWSRVSRDPVSEAFRMSVATNTSRDASTGEILQAPKEHQYDDERQFTAYCDSLGIQEVDILLAADDGYDVNGSHLSLVSVGSDERLRPCLLFSLKERGVQLFAGLTTEYAPERAFQRQLAIVIDNNVLSAPNIQEPITGGRGRITGQFTYEEMHFLVDVLQAGSLPVLLKDEPLEEDEFPPDPASLHSAQRLVLTGMIVLAIAWLFMLVRYRWFGAAGVLASFVQVAMTLVMLVVLVTFDEALITLIALGAFGVAACNVLACEFTRTGKGLLAVGIVATVLFLLGVAAACMYVWGGFELRNIALAILSTSLAALFVHTFQWLLPFAGQHLLHAAR